MENEEKDPLLQLAGRRMLVVDDQQPWFLDRLSDFAGIEVIHVFTQRPDSFRRHSDYSYKIVGWPHVQMVDLSTIDLVLMDGHLRWPGGDGPQHMVLLKEMGCNAPVIGCSNSEEMNRLILQQGAIGSFDPFDFYMSVMHQRRKLQCTALVTYLNECLSR